MTDAPPFPLAWSLVNDRDRLPCAMCHRPMDALLLFDVPVDRCPPHGVWFDKDELARVLERGAAVRPVREVVPAVTDSVGGAIALELAGEVAIGAAEVAAETASAGVIEGVLEVLGVIFSAIDF